MAMINVETMAGIRIDPNLFPRKPINGLKKSWANGCDAIYNPRNSVPASGSIWVLMNQKSNKLLPLTEIAIMKLNRSKYGLALVMTIETDKARMKAVKQMTAKLK